jgi:hypothetical protein
VLTKRVVNATSRKVSGTISSPDDISASTPTIALHDDTNADSWLSATWTTTPAYSATTGLWTGVAQTTSNLDFSTKTPGTYILRIKAGTTIVDCYIIRVIP